MKKLIFLISSIIALISNAQNWGEYGKQPATITPNVTVDNSELQCVYQHTIYDADFDENRDYYEILEIGKDYSKYGNYGSYQLDSVLTTYKHKTLTFDEFSQLANKYNPSWECIIKNMQIESLSFYGKIFTDRYIYEEPIEAIQWELHQDTQMICGYRCHKATSTFRGREWTAWYCDIPLNNGPWKFGNLPGLILKVEDSKQEHIFTAIMIKRDKVSFGYKKFNYFKTDREKFNKGLQEYMDHSYKYFSGELVPRNTNGSTTSLPKRKRFYNPIELE